MQSLKACERIVRFGVFELDLDSRQLSKRGRRVHLQDKPLETLILLLERRGTIVSREDLRRCLWPSDTFVVFDDSLNTAIRKLRGALGDSAESPRFIETIPRHGYRFIAPTDVGFAGGNPEAPSVAAVDVIERVTAAPPHAARAKDWPVGRWTVAVALTVLAVAGGFTWLTRTTPNRRESFRTTPLTTLPGVELHPSLSPDGNYVAFTWTKSEQESPDLYIQRIGSGGPLRITSDPATEYGPVWSPDGQWIAFLRFPQTPRVSAPPGLAELRLIPPLGGSERLLTRLYIRAIVSNPGYLAWCPDSSCLLTTDSPGPDRPDALFVVSLESGEKRPLTQPAGHVLGDCNPSVSPDGRTLVFLRVPAGSAGELHWVSLRPGMTIDSEPRRLTLARFNAQYPAWMPDSREIVFSARGNLWTLRVPGPDPPASPTRLPFAEDGIMPAVSRQLQGRSTRLVYVRDYQDANIWQLDTDTPGAVFRSAAMTLPSSQVDINPDLSASGRIAFASRRSGSMEIWVSDANADNAVQLTSLNVQTTTPRWSPDGQLITFQSNRDGQFDVFVIAASGGAVRNVTAHPANDHVPTFSRDGRWIYFGSMRSGRFQIWKVPVSGGDAIQVTKNGFLAGEASDGALYYTQSPGGPAPLWRVPAGGGEPTKVADGIVVSSFTIVDRGIYYADRSGNETRLQYYEFDSGRTSIVARELGDLTPLITASADGRRVLFARVDTSIRDLMLVEGLW